MIRFFFCATFTHDYFCLFYVFLCSLCRYDREGYAVDSQSLTETMSVSVGSKMNWRTLSDVKNENMGHGEKVQSTQANMAVSHLLKGYLC